MKPSTALVVFQFSMLSLVSSVAFAGAPSPGVVATPPALERVAAGAPTLKLLDQTAARGIESREPVEPAVRFPADVGEVVALVNIANSGAPTQIQQRWTLGGKVRFLAKLNIGKAVGWRTWSRHRMGSKDAGTWTVETLSPEGVVLGTLTFDVDSSGTSVSKAR